MSHDDSSWEDIYDSGQLERQLQNFDSDQLEPVRCSIQGRTMNVTLSPHKQSPHKQSPHKQSPHSPIRIVSNANNQIETESSPVDVGKVEGQIRILKRTDSSQGGAVERCHPENRHLIEQSVAQREKDYAVARERIMGPKHNKSTEKKKDRPKRATPQKPND